MGTIPRLPNTCINMHIYFLLRLFSCMQRIKMSETRHSLLVSFINVCMCDLTSSILPSGAASNSFLAKLIKIHCKVNHYHHMCVHVCMQFNHVCMLVAMSRTKLSSLEASGVVPRTLSQKRYDLWCYGVTSAACMSST